MKTTRLIGVITGLSIAAFALPLRAQISIPSDGSDGALVISNNTVVDLSQAVTGVWSNNNSGNAGKGIYDPAKWAVVFKYSSVTISNGATVTFKNHPAHAPVVWLVAGDVTVNGNISVDGQNGGASDSSAPDGGPGGFRGGVASLPTLNLLAGPGFGPGGSNGINGTYVYGNSGNVPLIGGSGAGGGGLAGSAGGGAILIACAGSINLAGTVHANSGSVPSGYFGGSGGSIRLIADQLQGSGSLSAVSSPSGGGDNGRIRIEANNISRNIGSFPNAVASVPVINTPAIWPATNAPTVHLVSVAGQSAPTDPHASLSSDVDLVVTTNVATLTFQTANFPITGTLSVFVKPRNGNQATYQATYITGDSNLATWQLTTNLPLNSFIVQERAVSP